MSGENVSDHVIHQRVSRVSNSITLLALACPLETQYTCTVSVWIWSWIGNGNGNGTNAVWWRQSILNDEPHDVRHEQHDAEHGMIANKVRKWNFKMCLPFLAERSKSGPLLFLFLYNCDAVFI